MAAGGKPLLAIASTEHVLNSLDESGAYVCYGDLCGNPAPALPAGQYMTLAADLGQICGLNLSGFQATCVASSGSASAPTYEVTQSPQSLTEIAIMGGSPAWGIAMDSTVMGWRLYADDTSPLGAPIGKFHGLSCGLLNCCALDSANNAQCWNRAGSMQTVQGPFLQVTVGYAGACVLDPSGRAGCWGSNQEGPYPAPP